MSIFVEILKPTETGLLVKPLSGPGGPFEIADPFDLYAVNGSGKKGLAIWCCDAWALCWLSFYGGVA